MRILVIGGTSTIARSCVDIWCSEGDNEVILAARDPEKLDYEASDLEIRYPKSSFSKINLEIGESSDFKEFEARLKNLAFDLCLIAIGTNVDQYLAQRNPKYLAAQLQVNGLIVVGLAEIIVSKFESDGKGTLAVVGSVAGDRGRAYNYVYGSAKSMVEKYIEGLQQRFGKSQIKVCLIKPGPTESPLTANHPGRMADSHAVARVIISGLRKGKRVIYAPGIWRYVMLVVRNIPFFIYKGLSF